MRQVRAIELAPCVRAGASSLTSRDTAGPDRCECLRWRRGTRRFTSLLHRSTCSRARHGRAMWRSCCNTRLATPHALVRRTNSSDADSMAASTKMG